MSESKLSYEQMAAMEARANAATPGPMTVTRRGLDDDWDIDAPGHDSISGRLRGMFGRKEDADFYAHAREDVPALIAEVRRLRQKANQAVMALDRTIRSLTND